jgi:murein DD-endopeptidase MepM/ murein hydrolase activator NlpD
VHHPRPAGLAISIVLAALPILAAQGQDSLPRITIITEPSPVEEGTLAWIRVRAPDGAGVIGGEAASEPLHFEPTGDSSFRALLPVPVETPDSFPITVLLGSADRVDTLSVLLPVRRTGYANEALRVPPAYARPDSAASARIQSEIARSREISRVSQTRRRIWRGSFVRPRASRITSRFGTARVYNGEVQSRHLGTDFAGAIGAPVNAAGRGVVALVADFYLAGKVVYLDHGAGLVTAYFHLSRIDVRRGQRVMAGQRIGRVGQSGRVTGPHLHWVARYGSISVDPMSLLMLVNRKR